MTPADLTRYAAFGATVVSPCSGKVASMRDGLPDLAPPRADRENPAGNHVVLTCEGLRVELAHFKHGSIAVVAGQSVAAGDRLGLVGNLGNTTEPHLHIHAVDETTGKPVQIAFHGVLPVRNATFRR